MSRRNDSLGKIIFDALPPKAQKVVSAISVAAFVIFCGWVKCQCDQTDLERRLKEQATRNEDAQKAKAAATHDEEARAGEAAKKKSDEDAVATGKARRLGLLHAMPPWKRAATMDQLCPANPASGPLAEPRSVAQIVAESGDGECPELKLAVQAAADPTEGVQLQAKADGLVKRRAAFEAEQSRGLRCCDGSESPTCLCHGPHQGCCSHHGGICGCE